MQLARRVQPLDALGQLPQCRAERAEVTGAGGMHCGCDFRRDDHSSAMASAVALPEQESLPSWSERRCQPSRSGMIAGRSLSHPRS